MITANDISIRIDDIERTECKHLTPYERRHDIDQWIFEQLIDTKYHEFWWVFPIAAEYHHQIEALKLKGVI